MKKPIFIISSVMMSLSVMGQFTQMTPGITVNNIRDIETGNNRKIIIATNAGILVYDAIALSWKHFGTAEGLNNNDIKFIEPYNNGFFYTSNNRHIGTCDFLAMNERKLDLPVSYNYISALHVNNQKDTLYGTDNGNLFLFNPNVQGAVTTGPIGKVTDINQFSGSVDYHVISTTDKIVIFQAATSQGFVVSTATTPIPSNVVLSNAIEETLTYDGTDKGLYIANFTNFPSVTTEIINTLNSPVPNDSITALALYGFDIFIGTPKGLACRMNAQQWHVYTSSNSNLTDDNITALAVDMTDLWIGTKSGKIFRIAINALSLSVSNEYAGTEINIYPQPCNNVLHVKGLEEQTTYNLYSITGTKMMSEKPLLNNSIDVKELPSGMYILELNTREQIRRVITIASQ